MPAFEALYHRYWDYLYRHAVRKTGNSSDAADILQDIFTELWDNRNSLPDMQVSMKYYLRGTVVHKLARYFKKKGFTEKHEKNFISFIEQERSLTEREEHPAISSEFFQEQLSNNVLQSISELPPRMRQVLLMRHIENYSIAEIATQLNISQQSVKNQVSNGLLRLRRIHVSGNSIYPSLLLFYWLMKP